jgi:RsiW-degrading membrane proteinase PrsW (M82 family)
MLNFILSILPGVLIIIFIYNKDRYEKEPYRYIFFCILMGMLSCAPAIVGTLLVESAMDTPNPVSSSNMGVVAFYAFIAVGLSEEFAKYIFLRFYIYPKEEFDEPMDGIVYAVVISMGFAILENILYVFESGLNTAILRMFTAVPAHAAFGVIMGYYVGLAKFESNPSKSVHLHLKGLLLAALVHGTYDFFLFQSNYIFLSLLAFVVLFIGIWMSNKLIKLHLINSPYNKESDEIV